MTTPKPHDAERQATRSGAVRLFAVALLLAASAAIGHFGFADDPLVKVFSFGAPLLAVVMVVWFLIKDISTLFFLRKSRRRLYLANALGILALVASLLYWLMVYPVAFILWLRLEV